MNILVSGSSGFIGNYFEAKYFTKYNIKTFSFLNDNFFNSSEFLSSNERNSTMNPKLKKKSHKLVVRFDSDTAAFIDEYSNIVKMNKTQLIRNAVTSAIFLNAGNPDYFNPKSIMSQSMLHFLFDRCSEKDLKQLAKMSYDLSINEIEMNKNSKDLNSFSKAIDDPEELARGLVKYIFSPLGHGWFDESNFKVRGKYITIYGKHNIGPNFQIFVKELLTLYFNMVQYKIIRERQEDLRAQAFEYNKTQVKRRFYSLSFTLAPISK